MEKIKLGDIAIITKLAGFEHTEYIQGNCSKIKDEEYKIPLFIGRTVKNGKLNELDYEWFIPEKISDDLPRSQLNEKCLIMPYVGTVGDIAIFDKPYRCHLGSNVAKITLKENSVFSEEYVYYFMKSIKGQTQIQKHIQGAIQKNITMEKLRAIEIDYLSMDTQNKIVGILSGIDGQIERNNAMIQKLQVLSNTIYSKTFSACKDKISFYDYPYLELLKPGITQFNGEKIYIPTAEVNGNNINFNSSKITFENRENRANMQPIYNSVWFAKMKNSNKHIYLTEKDKYLVDNFIFSTGFCGIKCQDFAFEYLIGTVELPYFEEMKDKLAHGATMESINNDDLKSLLIPNPSKELLEQYHNLTKDIYKQMSLIRIENYKLETLKNTLLPLLINGQLEV